MANDRYFLSLPMCRDLVNSARRLRLKNCGILQSTVIIQTGYQNGEGYAKNIPAF